MVRRRNRMRGGVGEEERRLNPPDQHEIKFVRRYSHLAHEMTYEISKPGEEQVIYFYPETEESKKWVNLGDNDAVLSWSEFTLHGFQNEPDMVQYNMFGRTFVAPLDGDTLNQSFNAPLRDGVIEFLANNPMVQQSSPPPAAGPPSSSPAGGPPLLSAWQGIGGRRKTKAKKSKKRRVTRRKAQTVKFAY